MPEPPLLLADRVLGIEGAPRSLGLGTIWTETDVTRDAWYLHEGRMPAGILAESGQADLLLISWLGIDFENRGERVYRLLGCDLTVHGELPRPGDTLRYEIHVDGHARQGDVRLFFFHYDCHVNGELRVTVRNGQAGFFTERELTESQGILWSAATAKPKEAPRLDPPYVNCEKDSFTEADLAALASGDAYRCFGRGFERALTHTRTPTIPGGRLRLVDEVTHFDRTGGPWGRGYLRARLALRSDHWFFPGHFKNDPCMPGTLMFEGGLQAMAIYLGALGYTLERDAWRFEPEAGTTTTLRCRGQALPSSKEVVYEVFVEEIVAGPLPALYADLLGSVDGLPAFHCTRVALRLVPGFPFDEGRVEVEAPPDDGAPIARTEGLAFDFRSLLAFAYGRPSAAFGEMARRFDGTRRMARAPGPPFAFMTRVRRVEGPIGGMQFGTVAEVDYDVPPDGWYFAENAVGVMPFAVLLEVALQACGWVAAYVGAQCLSETDRVFRNLDGRGTVHGEVHPDTRRLTTTAELTSCSTAGGITLVGFEATVRAGDQIVYTLKTSFGLFPPEAMREQIGLPATPELAAALAETGDIRIELGSRPERFFSGPLRLSPGKLLGIDRVTALWPAGGAAGLGRIRCEKDVDPGAWFFKSHFFQDPVQPGSLGLEAMLQALELFLIERGTASGVESPRVQALALGVPMEWKYRGQVLPENHRVVVEVEVTSLVEEPSDRLVVASGSFWVDGKCIYRAVGLSVRLSSLAKPSAR
jgi:3-hydroxymyristoyl/3-hydroxydecanoyl-(acyl carrier protein) dehydratase